jgi:hypothetical protein
MTALNLFLLSSIAYVSAAVWQQWRSGQHAAMPGRIQGLSVLGIGVAALWAAVTTPFWRHVLLTASVLTFASIMLPDETKFFERHPSMIFALPFAMGFIATHHGRSGVGTLASWVVLSVLLLAAYRFINVDPITGPWLRSRIGQIVPGESQAVTVIQPSASSKCPGIWTALQIRTSPVQFNPNGRCAWRMVHDAGCIFVQRAGWTGDTKAYGPFCPANKNTPPGDVEWVWTADALFTARVMLSPM